MLIQANSQTERMAEDLELNPKSEPPAASVASKPDDDVEMLSVDEQRAKNTTLDGITIKEEMMTDDYQPAAASTPVKLQDDEKATATGDPNKEQVVKMEVDEMGANQEAVKPDALAVESKDINIDPRTYCKLGHFHLLLEEFPKGILHILLISIDLVAKPVFFYSPFRLSEVLPPAQGPLEGHAVSVRTGPRLLLLQCISMVSHKFYFSSAC